MCTRPALRAPPLRLPALRALPPLMLMIRPQPAVFMKGMTAREQRSAPTYFVLKSCSKSSSTTVSIGPVAVGEPPGADPLLTRMCRPPSCCVASATMRSTCSLLVTSAARGTTRRFVSAASSRAVASRSPLFRATIATSTPSRVNSRAMALPMPRLPPVTIACLSCNPRSMALSPLGGVTAILLLHCSLSSLREPGASVASTGRCIERDYSTPAEPPPERDTWGAPHPGPDATLDAGWTRKDDGRGDDFARGRWQVGVVLGPADILRLEVNAPARGEQPSRHARLQPTQTPEQRT